MASEFLILWPVLVQAVGAASGEHQKEEESIYSRALQGTPIKDPVFVGDLHHLPLEGQVFSFFSSFWKGSPNTPPLPENTNPLANFWFGGRRSSILPQANMEAPKTAQEDLVPFTVAV